jgi:hypothetical protein
MQSQPVAKDVLRRNVAGHVPSTEQVVKAVTMFVTLSVTSKTSIPANVISTIVRILA